MADLKKRFYPQSDEGTHSYYEEHGVEINKVKKIFLDDLRGGKKIETAYGIFGPETTGSDAYIDEIVRPESGGTFMRLYGCSYLYKGYPDIHRVHGLQFPKAMMSGMAREIGRSWVMVFAFSFLFIFRRKTFLRIINKFFEELENKTLRWYDVSDSEYNVFSKEIKRAGMIVVREAPEAWRPVIYRGLRFLCLFLELDNGYRFPVQDALHASAGKGLWGFFRVLMEREAGEDNRRYKWRFIGVMLRIILFLSPTLKKVISRFFGVLDYNKIEMDESDRYFSLRFRSYNFEGRPFEEREAEWHRINREMGHVFLV